MIRAAAVVALAFFCAGAEDLPQDVLQLARLKLKVRQALSTLPDYTCLAVTERSRQAPGETVPRHYDTVRLEVAHSEGSDLYAWPGAASFEISEPGKLIGSGMFGSGEFATHLKSIFGEASVMRYAGAEGIFGQKLLRWDYSLTPSLATEWRVSFGERTAIAGAKGSFWADAESLDVVRVEAQADGLPPHFPISDVITTISYTRVRLGDRDVFLPQTASTIVTDFRGERTFNLTEFSHCRQYVTKSTVQYGVAAPGDGRPEVAGGVREIAIPAGLRITVELSHNIESAAALGDPIGAVVTADVIQKKRLVIPEGAVLRGRLRRMEPDGARYLVGLEFTDLEYSGCHARFIGRLVQAEDRKLRPSGVPGVGILLMDDQHVRLPRGTSMVWVTEDVSRK